jgi:hypothetical protein
MRGGVETLLFLYIYDALDIRLICHWRIAVGSETLHKRVDALQRRIRYALQTEMGTSKCTWCIADRNCIAVWGGLWRRKWVHCCRGALQT